MTLDFDPLSPLVYCLRYLSRSVWSVFPVVFLHAVQIYRHHEPHDSAQLFTAKEQRIIDLSTYSSQYLQSSQYLLINTNRSINQYQ